MLDAESGTVRLRAGDAAATISLLGAEPLSWQVGGRELLWQGDPAHWSYRAPILFPVVGASQGGTVRVDDAAYPMPQHGFARTSRFDLVVADDAKATFRLRDDAVTRTAYPFAFTLDVEIELSPEAFSLAFVVSHEGAGEVPYSIGFHPAFPWPLAGADRDGHRVVFDEPENSTVPEIAPGGLIAHRTRQVPVDGAVLPLRPDLFTEALVFLNARSRGFSFEAADGSAIRMEVEGLPHFAVWTKPTAPFVSLEAWSGHADHEDFTGELRQRASIALLPPGAVGRHAVRLSWHGPGG